MRLISDGTNALLWDSAPKEPIRRLIEGLFANYDLVLVEGRDPTAGESIG